MKVGWISLQPKTQFHQKIAVYINTVEVATAEMQIRIVV